MAFVQAWDPPTNAGASTSVGQSGTATSAGNFLAAALFIRADGTEDVPEVTLTDNSGSNEWTLLGSYKAGSGHVYLWCCPNALAVSSISASWSETATAAVILLTEHSGVGSLIDANDEQLDSGGGTPATLAATGADQLLIAAWGTSSSNRTWSVLGDGVSPTETDLFQGQQLSAASAYAYTSGAGDVAIGYDQTGGSATGSVVVNALFEEGSAGPDPLSVSVGSDQSVYVGQNATVTAVADGGSESYTYAWTRVSGPTGSFLNAGLASTTFIPSGGAGTYVLRCVVGDGVATPVQDDLVLTVTAAPDFVTVSTVNDSTSWVATGGTVLAVISDTSDSTLITSAENPSAQGLDVTFNNITLTEGQPLSLRLRARRADASSATVTARLYNGATLLSTSSATAVSSSFGDITITFPAADLTGLTYPRAFRVVTEWTATA